MDYCNPGYVAYLLLFLISPLIPLTEAQAQLDRLEERGAYPILNYSQHDYQGHAQNWATVQDSSGLLYVANGTGILEFDGVEWRGIETSRRTAGRSLAKGADGTVYVGGHGEFGYLSTDSLGRTEYTSLKTQDDSVEFKEVWSIVPTSDGVYFSTREQLFRYADSEMGHWEPETIFALGFSYQDTFHTVQPGTGLLRLKNDSLQLAPGGAAFSDDIVHFAIPRSDDRVLLAARDQGLLLYDGLSFEPFETEIHDELERDLLYHGTSLSNGRMALATRRGGVYIIDGEGRLLTVLNEEYGLRDQQVWHVSTDQEDGLWLALNSGLARVELSSPFTLYGEKNNLSGIVMDAARHGDNLYVATSTGTFRMQSRRGNNPSFEPVLDGNSGQCLTLQATSSGLLAGCEQGIYQINDQAHLIYGGTTRLIHRLETAPFELLASTREGTFPLRLKNGEWQVQEQLQGVPGWALSMIYDGDALWITTTADGASRVQNLNADTPTVTRYGTEDGLPVGWLYGTIIDGSPLFHTTEGIFRFDASSDSFAPDSTFRTFLPYPDNDVFLLDQIDSGEIWFQNESEIGRIFEQNEERTTQIDVLRSAPPGTSQTIYPEGDGLVWFGGTDGLVRYHGQVPNFSPDTPVQIRQVTATHNEELIMGGSGERHAPTLNASQNALRFSFALPAFDGLLAHRFQLRLDGFDEEWSGWTNEAARDYTNLPPGEYTFQARAQDGYGRMRQAGNFAFTIASPWHGTWWARLAFGLAAFLILGLAFLGATRLRMRQLEAENEWLENEVGKRTHTLQRANEKLQRVLQQNTEFLSIAAHDLKNPLTSILGFTSVLLNDDLEQDQRRTYLSLMRKSAERMSTIVTQLEDTNLLENTEINLQIEPVDLCAVTEEVVRRNQVQADAKSTVVRLYCKEPTCGLIDRQYFPRVIDNLLSNAIKFSPPYSEVRVNVATDGDDVIIRVADDGPGFTEADRQQIFGKLKRLSAEPTQGESSTGLGLYIVDTLVKLHNGSIHLETEPGEGSIFTVRIPLAKSHDTHKSPELSYYGE